MDRFRIAMMWGYYLLVVAFPFAVFAQNGGLPSRIVPCNGVDCNVCHLAKLAQNLINTGIFITIFLSAVLFAYAGFLYLTDAANPGQQSQAKKIFSHVAIGLAILLAAWLVVDTLMKSVLGGSFGPWNDVCRVINF